MRKELKYIELKSGYSDNGPAWIGFVSFSKSGKTLYFDGKGFQSLDGTGIQGNYFDLETGDEYWISGVKKDMSDRHRFGSGNILVEKRSLSEYLKIIGQDDLPKSGYELVEVDIEKPTDKINNLENASVENTEIDEKLYFKSPTELTVEQLEILIEDLKREEKEAKYNKGRRSIKNKRIDLELELDKRN
ncbi:hypothetical protein [Christiangramia fulva]|uniref:hypothetical protein n=1 Tax=Christiangramia fulva TaxID=2126553 RepID=UPI0018761406|nr:hypothetical protein [Christiangramia fulva]